MINTLKKIVLLIEKVEKFNRKKEFKNCLTQIKDLNEIKKEINEKLNISRLNNQYLIAKNLLYIRAQLIDIETVLKDIKILIEKTVDQIMDQNN